MLVWIGDWSCYPSCSSSVMASVRGSSTRRTWMMDLDLVTSYHCFVVSQGLTLRELGFRDEEMQSVGSYEDWQLM
jgi:hypothetical protein